MSDWAKESFVYLLWFIVIASFITGGIYLIGHAVAESNKASHDRQIECLHEGGEMKRTNDRSYDLLCNKDD